MFTLKAATRCLRLLPAFRTGLLLSQTLFSLPVLRPFAKRSRFLEKRKEKKQQHKDEVSKEYEGKDAEDVLKEINAMFSAVMADFRRQLKEMKISKASPKSLEKILVVVEGSKIRLQDAADITIRSADTVCIIPRDATYLDGILKV